MILPMKLKIQKIQNFEKLPFLTKVITTWFGSGLIKPAPGTWGSLGGLIVFYALYYVAQQYQITPIDFVRFIAPFSIFLFFIGIDESNVFESVTGKKDCPNIVIDEVAALWLVLCVVLLAPGIFWIHGLLGFALFRLFDIAKPFPINWIERKTKGGFGVMIDDIVAGIFTVLAFWVLGFLVRNYFV